MEYNEACDILTKYSTQLQSGIKETLPPEYFEAINTVTSSVNNVDSEHYVSPPETWTDLWAMFGDMADHAKDNGRAIINADQPVFLCLGWVCQNTDKSWLMRIADFKKQWHEGKPDSSPVEVVEEEHNLLGLPPSSLEETRALLYKRFAQSSEGRVALVNYINNMRQ